MPGARGRGRNNYRGNQNSPRQPQRQTNYEEMFPSYEDRHNSDKKKEDSHGHAGNASRQSGSQRGSQSGSQQHSGSRNGNHQNSSSGHKYKTNEYQQKLNEGKKKSPSQQLDSSHENQVGMKHQIDGQPDKSNSGQQRSSQTEDLKLCGSPKGRDSQAKDKPSLLKCLECGEYFNVTSRLPRSLYCGHTLCTACLQVLIKRDPKCTICQRPFQKDLRSAEEIVINYIVRDLVQNRLYSESDVKAGESRASEFTSCRPKSDSSKPIVTVGPNKPPESNTSYARAESMEWSPTAPEKSPHDSMCLEVGVLPTSHCATCQKWVCEKCGKIDHHQQKGCFLIAKKEALSQMTEAQVNATKATDETVENTIRELQIYEVQLDAFTATMQAAFESVAKEKERMKIMMEEAQKKKKELKGMVSAMANNKNLPDALASLRQVEELCRGTQQWTTTNASKTLDYKRVVQTTKEILLSTVQMKMLAESENRAAVLVLAYHTLSEVPLYSRMTVEGGRIHVHTLEKMITVPKGSRAIPLTCVKSCLDLASALTFLDIGWGGNIKGRIHIRLIGDTLRGRQFLMLCTGEAGPSFLNTNFHRVWWKGLPGEHIWGGDHDKGDGSGGTSVLKMSDEEKSSLISGRSLSVKAGLVAGRYEKTNISSIFRIYTKDSKGVKNESRMNTTDTTEVKDEAAFGQVEHGLGILDSALNHKNVRDVTIYACGVVIET